jgi:hypothetical protein
LKGGRKDVVGADENNVHAQGRKQGRKERRKEGKGRKEGTKGRT